MRLNAREIDVKLFEKIGEVSDLIDEALAILNEVDRDYGLTEGMYVAQAEMSSAYNTLCDESNNLEFEYNGV